MSEEEKKAIEIMKDFKNFGFATILIKYDIERVSATRLIDTSIQIILNLIEKQENKLKEIKRLCDTKPYTAYTLYGDILHDTDDILQIINGDDNNE